jgi:folate-binding protein YgfZ
MDFPFQAAIFPGAPAAWLRVSGTDSAGFLQGQFSQDLRSLAADRAAYGLWLSHKGRVIADSVVLAGDSPDEFWVGSAHCAAGLIRDRLERFIIADDVTVEDRTAEVDGVILVGDGVGAWLAAAPRVGWFFAARRVAAENWQWVFPRAEAEAVAAAVVSGRTGATDELERLRIAAGVPAIPADIGPADLPNEGGLEAEAISYTKGCYLGQEVMARVRSMGRIRRRLVRVRGSIAPPALPAPLWRNGRRAGELRSVSPLPSGSGFIGLALVAVGDADAGVTFAATPEGEPTIAIPDCV